MKKCIQLFFTIGIIAALPVVLSNCLANENDLISQNCVSGCTRLEGRLTTNSGSTGIANVKLTLTWSYRQMIGGITRTKAATTTDANGYYSINFLMRDDELGSGYYKIDYIVDKTEYLSFYPENSISLYNLKKDTLVTTNYLIPKKAFMKWNVVNQNQIQPSDYFSADVLSLMGYDGKEKSGAVLYWTNTSPSSSVIEVAGNQPLYVITYKTKGGVRTVKYDTITIPTRQTADYTFDFNK